jgi:ubiquinone/menaquinone biosynthesis C-methylase UbiE
MNPPLTRHQSAFPSGWSTSWLFNLGAPIYDWFTNQRAWRTSCAHMASGLPRHPGMVIVDLGCGPGISTIELARLRPDAEVIGLDIAPRMLTAALRRLRASHIPRDRIALVLGDAAQLPLQTESIDALTGHSFLYQLPDRTLTLGECFRVLRPGGRLILMEPNERPATIRTVLRVNRDPRHLFAVALWRPFSRLHGRFSAASLRQILETAGFVHCQVHETLGGLGLMVSAEKA